MGLPELASGPDCDHDGYATPADCNDYDGTINQGEASQMRQIMAPGEGIQ